MDEVLGPLLARGPTQHCGPGTFARGALAPGALLLREAPLLALDRGAVDREASRLAAARPEAGEAMVRRAVECTQLLEQFLALAREQQQQYFGLHDAFDYLARPDDFPLDINTIDVAIFKGIVSASREVAARVWGIFNSNSHAGRLGLGLARVNHSCSPTAELVWRPDLGALELRAVAVMAAGQEVTMNYSSVENGLNRSVRQAWLDRHFGFGCVCGACLLVGPRAEEEELVRAALMRLHHLARAEEEPAARLSLTKELLELAGRCRGVSVQYRLGQLQGATVTIRASKAANREAVLAAYRRRGRRLAALLQGPEGPLAKEWADPGVAGGSSRDSGNEA
jgi:hypothetical protein